jgi:hypothetical protein
LLSVQSESCLEQKSTRRQAVTEKVLGKVDEALTLGDRNRTQLMTAAKICQETKAFKRQEALLEEAIEKHPPAYGALFELHLIQLGRESGEFQYTKALEDLVKRAQARGALADYGMPLGFNPRDLQSLYYRAQ